MKTYIVKFEKEEIFLQYITEALSPGWALRQVLEQEKDDELLLDSLDFDYISISETDVVIV